MKNLLITVAALAAWFASCTPAVHAIELYGVDIHGFASQGYIQTTRENNFPVSDSGKGSFHFNDFAINFSKEFIPGLRAGLQVLAMDRGTYGKNKVTLDWAYADYHFQDWLGFRGGKVKIPLGLYNETRDNDALRTFIFLPQNEYYEYERDSIMAMTGGSIYGSLPLGGAGAVNYQLLVGIIPITSDGGSAKNFSAFISSVDAPLTVTDVSSTVSVVHHLEWRTPVDGLRATFSGLHSNFSGTATGTFTDPATNAKSPVTADWKYDSLHRYIFGIEYSYQDLVLAAEYQLDDYKIIADYHNPAIENFESKQAADGWYLSATYRFNKWFELGSYYHETYADRNHRNGSTLVQTGVVGQTWNAWQKDAALALRFDPMRNLVLKVEGHLEEGTWLLSETTGAERKKWYIVATKATVSF
jgi:hypothetical protein